MRLDKKLYDEIIGYSSGMAVYAASASFIHESGHYIGAKITGGNPEMVFYLEYSATKFNFDYSSMSLSEYIKDIIISLIGPPILQYSIATATLIIGRKLNRNIHRRLKAAMKAFSSALALEPFVNSIYSFLTKSGDYQILDNLGVPYSITIPTTFLLGSLITYLNFRERYPKLNDYIDDTQRKKYKPPFLSKIKAKIKSKSPIEVIADRLCKFLYNLEVFNNEDTIEKIRIE
jgi:hypothetical protein